MRLFLALSIFFAVVVVLPIVAVRVLIQLIQFYRERDQNRPSGGISGAVGGMMCELDRVIRPTARHVVEVQETAKAKKNDSIGGDLPPNEVARN
jgi:hypothetical protein